MENMGKPIEPPTPEAPHHEVCCCDYCYAKNGYAANGQTYDDSMPMPPSYYKYDMSDEEWYGDR